MDKKSTLRGIRLIRELLQGSNEFNADTERLNIEERSLLLDILEQLQEAGAAKYIHSTVSKQVPGLTLGLRLTEDVPSIHARVNLEKIDALEDRLTTRTVYLDRDGSEDRVILRTSTEVLGRLPFGDQTGVHTAVLDRIGNRVSREEIETKAPGIGRKELPRFFNRKPSYKAGLRHFIQADKNGATLNRQTELNKEEYDTLVGFLSKK